MALRRQLAPVRRITIPFPVGRLSMDTDESRCPGGELRRLLERLVESEIDRPESRAAVRRSADELISAARGIADSDPRIARAYLRRVIRHVTAGVPVEEAQLLAIVDVAKLRPPT